MASRTVREHHYQFSHNFLPRQAQATPNPIFKNLSGPGATMFLHFLWSELGKQVRTPDNAAGYLGSVFGADERAGWELVLIQMPPPISHGESLAIILARQGASVRSFVLDLGGAPGTFVVAEYREDMRINMGAIPIGGMGTFLRHVGGALGFEVGPSDVAALDAKYTFMGQPMPAGGKKSSLWAGLAIALVAVAGLVFFVHRSRLHEDAPVAPAASAKPRKPVGPSIYILRGGSDWDFIGLEDGELNTVVSSKSVRSIMAAKQKKGIFFVGCKPRRNIDDKFYVPSGPDALFHYDGSGPFKRLAQLPSKDFKLTAETSKGTVIAKKRNAIALWDGERLEVKKASELAGGIFDEHRGEVEAISVQPDGRVQVAVGGPADQHVLAERSISGEWTRTPFPKLPASERFRLLAQASMVELDEGLMLQYNSRLYRKKGDGFELVKGPHRLAYRPMLPLGDGLVAVGNLGRRERAVLYHYENGKLRVLHRYAGKEAVLRIVQGPDAVYLVITGGSGNRLEKLTADGKVVSALPPGVTIGHDREVIFDGHGKIWTWSPLSASGGHIIDGNSVKKFSLVVRDLVLSQGGPEKLPDFKELLGTGLTPVEAKPTHRPSRPTSPAGGVPLDARLH